MVADVRLHTKLSRLKNHSHMFMCGRLAAALLGAFLCSGCAFGTRHVALRGVTATSMVGTARIPRGQVSLDVRRGNDGRVKRDVGCVRNGFGMRTASVVAAADVCSWAKDSVAGSLTRVGYHVTSGKNARVSILVDTNKAFVDSYGSYKAEVQVAAAVHVDGRPVGRVTGEGRASSFNWAATSEAFSDNLHEAMEKCLSHIVPKIDVLIQESLASQPEP